VVSCSIYQPLFREEVGLAASVKVTSGSES